MTAPMVAARMAPITPPQREADAESRQQAKSGSLHQKAGEPAGDRANNQRYK